MVSTAVKPWNSAPQENGWKSVVQSSVSCKEIPAQLPQHWSLKAHWLQNLTQELLKVEEITTAVWTEKAEFCTSICIHGRIYRILIYWYEFYQFWSFLGWHCLGAFLNYHLFWFGFVIFFFRSQGKEVTHSGLGMKDRATSGFSSAISASPAGGTANGKCTALPPPATTCARQSRARQKETFQAGKPSAMCCCCIRYQKGSNKCSTFDEI